MTEAFPSAVPQSKTPTRQVPGAKERKSKNKKVCTEPVLIYFSHFLNINININPDKNGVIYHVLLDELNILNFKSTPLATSMPRQLKLCHERKPAVPQQRHILLNQNFF